MSINWQPIDPNNPPQGRVLLYFPVTAGSATPHEISFGRYYQLTQRGKDAVTHWCDPEFPA